MDPHINPATGVWDDNYYAQTYGGGGSSSGGGGSFGVVVPQFTFDYQKAEADALKELEPYYKQKLAEAGGDVERAKRLIEEDYARGVRYRAEDQQTQLKEDALTAEQEKRSLIGGLNQRGVLLGEITDPNSSKAPYSLYAQERFINPQTEKQALRKQAIERALARQSEIAGVERTRDIEEQDIQFPRVQRALEQEKLNKARFEMVPYKRDVAYNQYKASINPYLQGDQL